MKADELFQAGQLQPAIAALIETVRSNPADQSARLFLFELMLFTGDLDRARKQLDVLRYDNPQATSGVELLRQALDAEKKRRAVLGGEGRPTSLVPAPEHVLLRLEALGHIAKGDQALAMETIEKADAVTPPIQGLLNNKPFTSIRDGDDLFGPVLEVFGTGGNYCWVPIDQLEGIVMNAPRFPRDLILTPARIMLKDGPSGDVLIPNLYYNTHSCSEDDLRLGRVTDWTGEEGEPVRGIGGRLFMVDDKPVNLVDWRELQIT